MLQPVSLVINNTDRNDTGRVSTKYLRLTTETLHGEGEGDNSGGMSEIDAKIAAAEARTDTKFAQIMGEFSTMRAEINGRLDHIEKSTAGIKSTVIGTGIASAIGVIGLAIAVMAYGSQWFGLGMDAQQVSQRAVDTLKPQVDALDKHYRDVSSRVETMASDTNEKFDTLLKAVQQGQPKSPTSVSPLYIAPPKQ